MIQHPKYRCITEPQIISALADRYPLPSINGIISEFRCQGYQQAKRCLAAVESARRNKVYTLEDF